MTHNPITIFSDAKGRVPGSGHVEAPSCGHRPEMGRVHAEAWATNSRTKLVAVAGRNEAAAKEVPAAFGVPKVLTNNGPLLKDREIQLVSVANPDHFHAEQTIQLRCAGKHVLCEKPMATTLAECARMVRAAQ